MQNAKPGFGTPLKTPDYYRYVRGFIESLRSTVTHRQIAVLLNQAGYRSPTNKPFVRQTVANFLRRTAV